jgi:hypothetical protein
MGKYSDRERDFEAHVAANQLLFAAFKSQQLF